jgi:hypothetical protein
VQSPNAADPYSSKPPGFGTQPLNNEMRDLLVSN